MKIKFLGTGTSHGVPLINCICNTCTSKDKKNIRYRASLWIKENSADILIDTTAEFRLRALEYKINKIDALLMTHGHADHIAGLDDIRIYNEMQSKHMPLYGNKQTLDEIKKRFSYIFDKTQEGGGKPKIEMNEISENREFVASGITVKPLKILHGSLEILGYKFTDKLAYITDCSNMPKATLDEIKGINVLVLNALRHEPHPTHFNLSQAVDIAKKIGAKTTYFTHISHSLEHNETEKTLPDNIKIAYDGLEVYT